MQAFKPENPDYELSPYTGMTRNEWIRAGKHLLNGIFQNIKDFRDPVVMPRAETKVTYPHSESSGVWRSVEEKAEIFEGLTRSLFIAAPLIKEDPELEICGYKIADYYREQILRSTTFGDPVFVGTYDELLKLTGTEDPFRIFQQTVETCALVIGLWVSRKVIWEKYSKEEQDRIASFLLGYAHSPTVPQNWRLFNMLDMAFLKMYGYEIDEEIMMEHASQILSYYAGDGWYRDGHSFDYYSCWAFQVYSGYWCEWYGYENAPEIAAEFEKHSNELMKTYADFFDGDGHTNMWGRSNIYRCAATSPFEANFSFKNPSADPGLSRRIASGSLLQFITREDFYYKGIPNMGFYGQFAPLVQGYSCAESPFWLGKAFLCLDLPADHPFWTAKENNGSWERLKAGEVKETVLDGPALCFTNHADNKTTVLRTGKIVKNCMDEHGMWNYSKLAYNSKYPWESAPDPGEIAIEAQQYVITDGSSGEIEKCNVTFWNGRKDKVLYRRQFFNYTLTAETHWMQAVDLADFAVPKGIFRADRIRLFREPVTITLGAWGFPDNKTDISEAVCDYSVVTKGDMKAKALILKGYDSLGNKKQLAMTIYDGWDDIFVRRSTGTNPESRDSLIIYAKAERKKLYGGAENHIMISQVITSESHDDLGMDELFPIKSIKYSDRFKTGAFGDTIIALKDGTERKISFEMTEGRLML